MFVVVSRFPQSTVPLVGSDPRPSPSMPLSARPVADNGLLSH